MFIRKQHLSRRTFLRGAGVTLALPFLEAMLPAQAPLSRTAFPKSRFAGGWAMVIRRAVIIDLARGARLVRVLNVIAAVGGIAPIVGPLFWDALTGHPRWVASVLEFSTG